MVTNNLNLRYGRRILQGKRIKIVG